MCQHPWKRAGVYISRLFNLDAIQMPLWEMAWLTCMQNEGALRCLESVQQDAISKCGHLECYGIGTCEMWARAEGTGTISTNATEGCVT
jgi:hypothetical protein